MDFIIYSYFFQRMQENGDAASSNPETSSLPASLEAADSDLFCRIAPLSGSITLNEKM